TGRKEKGDPLNIAIDKMTKKTRDLRRQLRKAVMDHISDSFLETNVPLLVLIEAAKSGNEKEVKEYAQVFREHANKLVEVSQERPEDWDLATGLFSPCGSWNLNRQPFYGFPGVIMSWNLSLLSKDSIPFRRSRLSAISPLSIPHTKYDVEHVS
ncbi:Catenin alpha-2, partial [Myotis davidii]